MVDNWRSELGTNSLGQLEEVNVLERLYCTVKSYTLNQNSKDNVVTLQKDVQLMDEVHNKLPSVTSSMRRFILELQSRRKQRCITCEQSTKLEETNRTLACSTNRTTPKKEVEDKVSEVKELSNKVDGAMASIELLISRLVKHIQELASSGQIDGVGTSGDVQKMMDTSIDTKSYQDDCKTNGKKYIEKSNKRVDLPDVDRVDEVESSLSTVSSSSSVSSWTTTKESAFSDINLHQCFKKKP